MTFLLKSVPDVIRATTSYLERESKVRARNDLCKKDGQQPLIDVLKNDGYTARVISVD